MRLTSFLPLALLALATATPLGPTSRTALEAHASTSTALASSDRTVLRRSWLNDFVTWWDCHIVYGNGKNACS